MSKKAELAISGSNFGKIYFFSSSRNPFSSTLLKKLGALMLMVTLSNVCPLLRSGVSIEVAVTIVGKRSKGCKRRKSINFHIELTAAEQQRVHEIFPADIGLGRIILVGISNNEIPQIYCR